ncbi:MAG TPA: SGNH/GDSL hydrolase family protein [Pyrinomonadaceae bacterium]|jgi:lysophospholipase L1-like esterase
MKKLSQWTSLHLLFLLLACAGFACSSHSFQRYRLNINEDKKDAPVVYMALGDSTCLGVGARKDGGYAARILTRIRQARPESQLINLCRAGATANTVLREQTNQKDSVHPTLITLSVGGNDLIRGVEEGAFAEKFEEIVLRLKEFGVPIVVTNLPDISLAPALPASMREDVRRRAIVFNARIGEIAKRHGLLSVDLYGMSREVIPAHPEFFSTDGFHPSDAGYEFWVEMMWPEVKKAIFPAD